jgi:hypothetical protein
MSASLRVRQGVPVIVEEVRMKLVTIPCGKSRIWKKTRGAGPQKACDAYSGSYFNVNRQYAEYRHGEWMILSPKYGFMHPDFVIPGDYDVTFESPDAISVRELKRQAERQGLSKYANVTVLVSRAYVGTVTDAFPSTNAKSDAPFVGHSIGVQMGLIEKSLHDESGQDGTASGKPES